MVSVPSSIWSLPVSGTPLVVGGCTVPRWRCTPITGTSCPSTGSWPKPNSDQPATAGLAIDQAAERRGGKLP